MRLSRGWRGLLLFWVGVLALGGAGVGVLCVLGPPSRTEQAVQRKRSPTDQPSSPATIASANAVMPADSNVAAPRAPTVTASPPVTAQSWPVVMVPAQTPAPTGSGPSAGTTPTEGAAPQPDVAAVAASPQTTPIVVVELPPSAADLPPKPEIAAQPQATPTAAIEPPPPAADLASERENAAPSPQRPERQLQLRITRDSKRCPNVPCYKWHLIKQRLKPPPGATIDLASLDLAPNLRSAVDKGEIDLFIDAIEHHRTINGRDTVTFVATSLDGVMSNGAWTP